MTMTMVSICEDDFEGEVEIHRIDFGYGDCYGKTVVIYPRIDFRLKYPSYILGEGCAIKSINLD